MSATRAPQTGSCPACDQQAVDTTFEDFDGLCTACGFVIHDGANTTVPERLVPSEADEDATREDWLSVCRIHNATEQQIAEAFARIETLADQLEVSIEVREMAADTYCDAFRVRVTDGRDTASLVAACLRIASIQAGIPIPTGRLTASEDVSQSQFRRSGSAIREQLDLALETPDAVDYLEFVAVMLGLSKHVRNTVQQLLEDGQGSPLLVGKDPVGIAAGAVFVVCDDYTQETIARVSGVSTETIRLRAKTLREVNDG